MGSQRVAGHSSSTSLSKKTGNKLRRQALYVKQKQSREKERREARFRRKKDEDKEPELRRERLAKNQPITIDKKRTWDEIDDDSLGANVDLAQLLKRRRMQQEEAEQLQASGEAAGDEAEDDASEDVDSMLGSDDEEEEEEEDSDEEAAGKARAKQVIRDSSLAPSTTSTSATLDLTPDSLISKFPSLFADDGPAEPQILITTSLNSTLHSEAEILCSLFPNSHYIPRSKHAHSHKFSVREISKFATNKGYSSVLVLREDQKRPVGLDIIHLPEGPTFHFSISNWLSGKKLPNHGNPTNHHPELLLNNFKTPLGILSSRLFLSLFPKSPELQGRSVVTFHNQRDYIFLRRHRYIFRDRKSTEKAITSSDGQEMKGVKGIRTGLQELGPRMTLKLRRVDKAIGRSGSDGVIEWEWKAKMEKKRTRFNL